MKNNETGEFELVLGNRQLLSGFFIVALLFGVAFAMGYIVGRNSTPSPKLQAETAASATNPVPRETRPEPVASSVPAAEEKKSSRQRGSERSSAGGGAAAPGHTACKGGPRSRAARTCGFDGCHRTRARKLLAGIGGGAATSRNRSESAKG